MTDEENEGTTTLTSQLRRMKKRIDGELEKRGGTPEARAKFEKRLSGLSDTEFQLRKRTRNWNFDDE